MAEQEQPQIQDIYDLIGMIQNIAETQIELKVPLYTTLGGIELGISLLEKYGEPLSNRKSLMVLKDQFENSLDSNY